MELLDKFKYIIELDRANSRDAVFYCDGNEEFHEFITKEYWIEDFGTWSDICTLSPALEISSVNFSCGYYNAHTTKEYVILEEMENNINEVIKLLGRTDINAEAFTYKPVRIYSGYNYGLYDNYWKTYYTNADIYGDDYWDYDSKKKSKSTDTKVLTPIPISVHETNEVQNEFLLEVILQNGKYLNAHGITMEECWMNLFMENTNICFDDIIDYYFY